MCVCVWGGVRECPGEGVCVCVCVFEYCQVLRGRVHLEECVCLRGVCVCLSVRRRASTLSLLERNFPSSEETFDPNFLVILHTPACAQSLPSHCFPLF